MSFMRFVIVAVIVMMTIGTVQAGVVNPQLGTDHPWYPGELDTSTFARLKETQAKAFERVVGHLPKTDEEIALAAWMWRNTHYAHGEEGRQNLWGGGFQQGDTTTREYWTGQFAHGFGLCGTTHAQWTAELNALLGPGRSRTVGVVGHNACEVFLKGDAYGNGRWVLLDHDVSTVIYDPEGKRLLSIDEIRQNLGTLTNTKFKPERQKGWPLSGLHPSDAKAYAKFNVVEHLPGYAGPPPQVHLRTGESLKRYFQPGLEDGKTFVFWGRNYKTAGIPGPERSRTYVNQPERFFNNPNGSGYRAGQARFGNAVYTYRPDFKTETYREAVVAETNDEIVLEFRTPFIIAATPADDSAWGIYQPGCRNGLRVTGHKDVSVVVSIDRGGSWHDATGNDVDLTDVVKGCQQYWLKFKAGRDRLKTCDITITTVCQANPAMFPRLKDGGSNVRFEASETAIVSAGPNRQQAEQHVIDGAFESPRVTMSLQPPRGRLATHLYAAAHIASSNPPNPEFKYQIEYSTNAGRGWKPVVKDWQIIRQGNEPKDFWSQSFCYGETPISPAVKGPIQIRFRNDGGKRYLRCEAHLGYQEKNTGQCKVTFSWSEKGHPNRVAIKVFSPTEPLNWNIATGQDVVMKSVAISSVAK